MTWDSTTFATSSPVLVDGRSPPSLRDGRARSGPGPAPASPSPSPGSEGVQQTLDISGPSGGGSSMSAALQRSLASRLPPPANGSTRSSTTWRERATRRGRVYWEHTPLARRTPGRGYGGAHWRTVVTSDNREPREDRMVRDADVPYQNLRDQAIPWASPRAQATAGKREPRTGRGEGWSLALTEQVVPWPSVVASDGQHSGPSDEGQAPNGRLRYMVWGPRLGELTHSGDAPTAGSGRARLNPAFGLWLMGYPPGWMDAAPSAAAVRSAARGTPSSRR